MTHPLFRYVLSAAILGMHALGAAWGQAQDDRILRTVEANTDAQLNFLADTVNINSGTLNVGGVKAVGALYRQELEALGFEARWIDMPTELARAGHLIARRDFGRAGPHLLLIGHIDTVFEADSPFQRFERVGDRAKGPGIADMKGGNAVVIYALKALLEADAAGAGTVTVFFTGDEEAPGRPLSVSRADLVEAGKAADYALNFEGGSAEWAVIGRRGSSGWELSVTGERAHSSGIFRDEVGAGAIFEAARILNRFYGEVRGPFGLTFNPGVIGGGTFLNEGETPLHLNAYGKTNVVAQTVRVKGGLRFMSEAQKDEARALMRTIVDAHLPKTDAEISFTDSYPAMEATPENEALLNVLNGVHARLGVPAAKPFPPERRGAADISFVAPYVTSMDGLGVDGSGSHSPREDMDIASMTFATKRAALLIHDLLHSQ